MSAEVPGGARPGAGGGPLAGGAEQAAGGAPRELFDDAPQGSERGFGFVVATVLAGFGVWPVLGGGPPRWTLLALAGASALVAIARPRWLARPNSAWMALGRLLHRVTSPIVIAVIYFGVITPTGLVMRALGKDPLRLRRDPDAETYWLPRAPSEDRSMERQF